MTRWLVPILAVLLVFASVASLLAGTVSLRLSEVFAAFDGSTTLTSLIVTEIRAPRIVLAILTGGILGLSGAVLQGLLRNPLAEPGLLGVSSGASLGAVIAIYYGFSAVSLIATPVFALVGALVTASVALGLARGGGTLALILAGAAVSSIAIAGVSLALNLSPSPYAAYEIMTWLMGSLADRSWVHVRLAAPFVIAGGRAAVRDAPLARRAGARRSAGREPRRRGRARAPARVDRHRPRRRRGDRGGGGDRLRRADRAAYRPPARRPQPPAGPCYRRRWPVR